MNWNPYKRKDYKNMSDAELAAEQKSLTKKTHISLGINCAGALVCAYALAAMAFPALIAVPTFYGTWMVAIGLLSMNRFNKLGSECRSEGYDRDQLVFQQHLASLSSPASAPAAPALSPAPAPDFNSASATVLDEDIEISRPLQFKKKAPGARA